MRRLIAPIAPIASIAMAALLGCGEKSHVEVSFTAPDRAPSLAGKRVRVTVGTETQRGFITEVGAGGDADAGPIDLELSDSDRELRARVLIYDGTFDAILHGQSAAFTVEGERTPVEVSLDFPPEGSITRATNMGTDVRLEMQARRWSKVELGLAPRDPTHEVERDGGPAGELLERFVVDYPLDMIECELIDGCTVTVFADFLAQDGVGGPTATATIGYDRFPPGVNVAARLRGAARLGGGSQLVVDLETTERVAPPVLTLEQTILHAGGCAGLGPYACSGAGRKFTCTVNAPAEPCDASYNVKARATDLAGNEGMGTGAEIGVDTIPPQVGVSGVECADGLAIVPGTSVDAVRVELRDEAGVAIAWTEDVGTFRLVGSSSTAASVVAIDGGGNEASTAVACP